MTRLRAFLADDNGTATIEFVFIIPIVMTIFMASIESGLFMVRHVMLERSVDIVVRDIRLGRLDYLAKETQSKQHEDLKQIICSTSVLAKTITKCMEGMRISMQAVNTANFDMPLTNAPCRDEPKPFDPADPGPPATEFKFGSDNEIMLMRVCLLERPLFPSTVIGAGMVAAAGGKGVYAIQTTTIFVNEPG
jgi:hypothetical protein